MFTLSVAAMNRRVKAVDADFKNHAYIRFGHPYIENRNIYIVYFVITLSYNNIHLSLSLSFDLKFFDFCRKLAEMRQFLLLVCS
jgi:hypothetical protein